MKNELKPYQKIKMSNLKKVFSCPISLGKPLWLNKNEVVTPGRYLFESTGGDPINREHDIIEKDGELGVRLKATRRFIKVKDFRNDCRLKLIEATDER
ncbi:MAG: hypothetical protein KAR42_14745 [candidate division Zixibacteria bacterium]|nr:hypothetical protein [candidate division Zixibacteria bacterium]